MNPYRISSSTAPRTINSSIKRHPLPKMGKLWDDFLVLTIRTGAVFQYSGSLAYSKSSSFLYLAMTESGTDRNRTESVGGVTIAWLPEPWPSLSGGAATVES